MKTHRQLVKEGIINDEQEVGRVYIAKFYKDQLREFAKLGIGKETNNGVRVTQSLIDITTKRLHQLQPLMNKENKK